MSSPVKDYAEKHQCGLLEAVRAVANIDATDKYNQLYRDATLARDLADLQEVVKAMIRDKLETI